jgi:hypothetical protein
MATSLWQIESSDSKNFQADFLVNSGTFPTKRKPLQTAANLGNCPPKAEVTSSNLVGRASDFKKLARPSFIDVSALSAECPRNLFSVRSLPPSVALASSGRGRA